MVNRNSSSNPVRLRVDHGHCTGLRVDDVYFVANRVRRKVSRIDANLESPVLAKVDEIEHRNSVRASVADIGVLPVTVRNIRKATTAASREDEERRGDSRGNEESRYRESEERGHCSESIKLLGGKGKRQSRRF